MLLALGLAQSAIARPPHGHRDRSAGEAIERHAERLGLDAQTREEIERIVREADARRDALDAQRREARRALRALLEGETPSEAAVMEQAEALGTIETQARKSRLRAMVRIRALLTPTQRAELVRIREEQPRRGRGREHGRRCADDLGQHCADARGPAALRCLAEHWSVLDPPCREGLERWSAPPAED